MHEELILAKKRVIDLLRRAGIPDETLRVIDAELPDPVDVDKDGYILLRHGVTHDALISALGGSP